MGCGFSSALPASGDSQLRLQNASPTPFHRLNFEAKIVLLGDSGVGKSSLALRFCRGRFPVYHEVTIGAAFLQQTLTLQQGAQLKLHIWDTGGQERFRAMAPLYYRDAAGAVVVYDLTAPSSLEAVKFWTKELQQHLGSCCIAVAANKSDLLLGASEGPAEEQQQQQQQQQQQLLQEAASGDAAAAAAAEAAAAEAEKYKNNFEKIKRGIEEVKSFCAANKFAFVECSAKTGQNVNRLFEDLARDVFVRLKDAAPVDI